MGDLTEFFKFSHGFTRKIAKLSQIKRKMSYSRDDALKVNDEKTKIEAEISEWKSVLDSEQNIGMDGPLVDNEGFPRNDLDIPKIRMARQKIICLSNDHKELMKKLAAILEDIHSQNPTENLPVSLKIFLGNYFINDPKKFVVSQS